MSEPRDDRMCYVARCRCGQITGAVIDTPGRERETAKDVASFVKSGRTVERLTCADVRVQFGRCRCPAPAARQGALEL